MPDITQASISGFLQTNLQWPLLDVRSEGEYAHGHIPGAISFPILNNEDRALVGTCYKQQGHEKAVVLGYKLTGPKFHEYVAEAYRIFPVKKLRIHCYRGGLRSRIMAGLLQNAGFQVTLLTGGYKTYRAMVLETLEQPLKLEVIGGFTGSDKTGILHSLHAMGQQILDIEALANHRGSAFGGIGLPQQPTQEQFENNIAHAIGLLDLSKTIWVEDESRMTGRLKMPDHLYNQVRAARVYFIDKSFEERSVHILKTYGQFDVQPLAESTAKLVKRLGDMRMKQALAYLETGDMKGWLDIVLTYYDKTYLHGVEQREPSTIMKVAGVDPVAELMKLHKLNADSKG